MTRRTVAAWLGMAALGASACRAAPASPGLDAAAGGSSESSSVGVGRSLRRLSAREYNNVVRDLLGDTSQPASLFGQEVFTNGFDNGSDSLTVQGTDVLAFQAAAESLAATAVANQFPALVLGCDPTTDPAQACVSAFLATFATKAYRRPLTGTEQQRLETVYSAGAATGGLQGGIQLMLEAILQ